MVDRFLAEQREVADDSVECFPDRFDRKILVRQDLIAASALFPVIDELRDHVDTKRINASSRQLSDKPPLSATDIEYSFRCEPSHGVENRLISYQLPALYFTISYRRYPGLGILLPRLDNLLV